MGGGEAVEGSGGGVVVSGAEVLEAGELVGLLAVVEVGGEGQCGSETVGDPRGSRRTRQERPTGEVLIAKECGSSPRPSLRRRDVPPGAFCPITKVWRLRLHAGG